MSQKITRDQATFASIRDLIGNSLQQHRFDVEGGEAIAARVKVTTRAGLIHTKRLHAVLRYSNNKCERYTEQPNGNFKRTGLFVATAEEFAGVTV
ncbi:hypothetical protein [Paraburkholderia sp. GAS32]|uniref:hypothetical protein n=1 Tax=Paraburkholderia sp. GAS32 TaxID=3035129 RepID=UPI003D250F41